MIGEPRISVMCDNCNEDFDYEMTALVGGAWDNRNLDAKLRNDGFVIDGDKHICADCHYELNGGD